MVFSDSLWSALIKSSTLFEEGHERKPNQEDRFFDYGFIFTQRIQFKSILKQIAFTIFYRIENMYHVFRIL